MLCSKPIIRSFFSMPAHQKRQNVYEPKMPSHASCYLSRALLLASSLSSPELNLPMTSVKVQGPLSPSLHSFNGWSFPSASLASLAHSFANVSHGSGSDWSNSAVCNSVGTCPRRMVSLTKIYLFFPCYLWSLFIIALLFISYLGQG